MQTTYVSLDTCGSNFNTVIAIYRWQDDSLVLEADNDNSDNCGSGTQSKLEFSFVGGSEYLILLVRIETAYGFLVAVMA